MGYPVNIEEPGGIYHLIYKAANDRFVFVKEDDIKVLMAFMLHYLRKHKIKIYAFSIMSNHVHMVAQNPLNHDLALKWFIRDVKREYAKYFNIRYGESGSVFKRSYRQVLIKDEVQFVRELVYVLDNPVKACLVKEAFEYRYSSVQRILSRNQIKKNKFISPTTLDQSYQWAKQQVYAGGLSNQERAKRGLSQGLDRKDYGKDLRRGRHAYKTRGKYKHWFENRRPRELKGGPFPSHALLSPLPEGLKISPKTLREMCQEKALRRTKERQKAPCFYMFEGSHILYRSRDRNDVIAYQARYRKRFSLNAQSSEAIFQTDEGVWVLIAKKGSLKKRSA